MSCTPILLIMKYDGQGKASPVAAYSTMPAVIEEVEKIARDENAGISFTWDDEELPTVYSPENADLGWYEITPVDFCE